MRIKNLIEGLNAQQRSVPQLPAQAKAKHISVLGSKTDPQHPFAGYMVGADESAEPGAKRLGPDRNDPYEQGWRARPGHDFNPYQKGSKEHQQWAAGQAEREAQPHHYDESAQDDIPDLEEVGEPVLSMMDAERRLAAGDRIFVAHEMDEEPFEVFNVDDLKGYTYDQMLAVPQGETEQQINEIDAVQLQHLQKFSQQVAQMSPAELEAMNQYLMSVGLGAAAGVWGVMGGITFGDMFMNMMRRTMRLAKKKTEVDAEEVIKLQRQIVSIHKRLKTLKSEPAIAKYQAMLKQAYEVLEELEARQDNKVAESERNELDTPAVQAALQKMAERHKGEKWSKEQLAALGKRIAARGQKTVKEDVTKEDIISKLKDRLGDYLSDISKEIKKDPDLVDKLAAKSPGDQMGPPVKTVTTDDGHQIQIHGNEDDGFRISIKNRQAPSRFSNLDEAVMACEMYCARRRTQALNADYVEEA